jgi:hypothetical protein
LQYFQFREAAIAATAYLQPPRWHFFLRSVAIYGDQGRRIAMNGDTTDHGIHT